MKSGIKNKITYELASMNGKLIGAEVSFYTNGNIEMANEIVECRNMLDELIKIVSDGTITAVPQPPYTTPKNNPKN